MISGDLIQQLFILLVAVWVLGALFRKMRLPGIFGDVLAGVLVGPLVFGFVPPDSEHILALAELGIFFIMLHSGLETDPKSFFNASKKFFPIAIGGMILPLLGGYGVGRWFGFAPSESFYIGMGLSITAIAVSVRLFKDCRVSKTSVARVSLGAALIDDVFALILFSIALSIGKEGAIDFEQILFLVGKIVVFFGVSLYVGSKYFHHLGKILYRGNKGFTFTLVLAFAFGYVAHSIGLHTIVGAFLAGLFIREEILDEHLFKKIEDRIFGLSYSFLGPIFFASLAFHLDFSILKTNALFLIVLLAIAILGKVIGAGIPAYFLNMTKIESLAVGLAMNSRGAVELIIATVGLEAGILSEDLFSALVIMAFVTTLFSIVTFKPVAKILRKKKKVT